MTILRTNSPATAAMIAGGVPKSVTPSDIVANAACKVFVVADPFFVTGTSAVSAVTSIGQLGATMAQATGANQPAMAFDAALGRNTLSFGAARDRFMTFSGTPVTFNADWTMLTVFKTDSLATTNSMFGDESSGAADRAALQTTSTGKCRVGVGGTFATDTMTILPNTWYAALASYVSATKLISLQMYNRPKFTAVGTTAPSGSISLRLGDNTSSYGWRGNIDMAAFWNVDLFNATYSDDLANVWTMLDTYYGTVLDA